MSRRLDHHPPPWAGLDAIYLITLCARYRVRNTFCHPTVGPRILKSIQHRNENQIWFCELAVLMPDHVHLIVNFPDHTPMTTVIRNWKSYLAKDFGIRWQKNFFDHRLRNAEERGRKSEYVRQNPVRARLVRNPQEWPYVWLANEFIPPQNPRRLRVENLFSRQSHTRATAVEPTAATYPVSASEHVPCICVSTGTSEIGNAALPDEMPR